MIISNQKYSILTTDVIELEKVSRIIYQMLRAQPEHRLIEIEIRVEEI